MFPFKIRKQEARDISIIDTLAIGMLFVFIETKHPKRDWVNRQTAKPTITVLTTPNFWIERIMVTAIMAIIIRRILMGLSFPI
jgi:hypothetical protein